MALLRIDQALRQLREDLARVDYLIRLLESMAEGKGRRGRPPKFLAALRPAGRPRPSNRAARRSVIRANPS